MRSPSSIRQYASSMEKYLGNLCQFFAFIAGLALLVMMVAVVLNVVLRISFTPLQGTIELASVLFVVAVAFGIAYTTIKRGQVDIEVITRKLPVRVQNILAALISVVNFGLWIVITWRVFVTTMEAYHIGEFLPTFYNMRVAPWRFALLVGLVVLCLTLLAQMIERVAKAVKR